MPRKHIQTFVLACLLLSTSMSESALAAAHPTRAAAVTAAPSGPHREIFGFALASSLADPTFGYPSWDFNLVSTAAFFGLHVGDDGRFANDNGWSVWTSSQLSGLVGTAHSHGAKVVLTVILQDFGANTPHMCAGLSRGSATISLAVSEMRAKGLDGINLDYEGLNGSCGTSDSSWARHSFTNLTASFRSAMPAGSYLSVDTYASSATDPLGFFDVPGLASSADSLFVMAYDLEYSNWQRAPLSCSSFCLGPTAPLNSYYYNDASTANQYMSVVPASKVILGVPYYGRKACVSSATPNQAAIGSVVADTYLDASTEATDPAVQPGSYATHRDANDPSGQERWDTWFNTTLNCTRELYWDDATSLGLKYDLVVADNLRGVGIWNLNYGGGAPELWNMLDLKFGNVTPWTSLGGSVAGAPVTIAMGSSRFDAFVRGSADNALWHRFFTGSAWSGWESLGGVLTADPAAVLVGTGRVDLFGRGTDNALWHRFWNGAAWTGWESLGAVMTSAPTVVSWGPNRIDVFVRGTDNALWHRATSDGSYWGRWESLGGVLASNPIVTSWGANRLDVFGRGTDGGLWQRSWDGASWGAWKALGGAVRTEPAVVSSTNRLDLFVQGTNDGGLWQASWNGSAWAWTSLGGTLTSKPTAASCAAGHLDVVVSGNQGVLWRRGFNGGAWGAWQRLGGLWSGDQASLCPPATSSLQLFERDQSAALWQTTVAGS
jgi:hypothetical protein